MSGDDTEQTLSPFCDYCGQEFGGTIIESKGPCPGCMEEYGSVVDS